MEHFAIALSHKKISAYISHNIHITQSLLSLEPDNAAALFIYLLLIPKCKIF